MSVWWWVALDALLMALIVTDVLLTRQIERVALDGG